MKGDSQANKRPGEESEGGDARSKNIKLSDSVDANSEDLKELEVQEQERVENLEKGSGEHGTEEASCNWELKSFEDKGKDLDVGSEDDELPVLGERREEISYCSCDETELELVEILVSIKDMARRLELEEYDNVRRRMCRTIEDRLEKHQELRENAHIYAWKEGHKGVSSSQQEPPLPDENQLGKSPGPFSSALKIVRERKMCQDELIKWNPPKKVRHVSRSIVPPLLDLSLKALAQNCDAIISLELVPDILRQKLADLICNLRKMNFHILQLLVNGSPTEICVKDCSRITEEQFFKIFQNFDWRNLEVLQLDLCGQCRLDYIISHMSAQLSMNLSSLNILSLKGACCLSDDGLKALAGSTPALQSVNLSECSLLTHADISILANSWGSTLKELYIDDCQKIDAELILPALKNLEHLEVLSIAGNPSVRDLFVRTLVSSRGEKLKELNFDNCQGLTNDSLELIGKRCTNLLSLNISNLDKLTDLGLQYLADGCRHIRTLKLCRNTFSDEAIAAFLEASGEYMMELSLNYVTLVGPCTAISLSKCCPMLVSLDLSWCRNITNEALGLIVDSCSMLKQVKLFGCTQISKVFLKGHSNSLVQILGLSLTPLSQGVIVPEPQSLRLRYGP